MGSCCDLEVDVNGEEIFIVTKRILTYFSCKFSNMFAKSRGKKDRFKVVLHDFPGGAEVFELILRYCYNDGKIEVDHTNIFSLHCAANFMEMTKSSLPLPNLTDQAKKYLEEIPFWTWSRLLSSLKQCENLYTAIDSRFLEKYLDFFVVRLYFLNFTSPYTYSSSEISISQALSDISSDSERYQDTGWIQDFSFVNISLFEKLVRGMISHKFDHTRIFKFIICYRRRKFVGAATNTKVQILEVVISLLFLLDRSLNSSKGIFEMFRMALYLKVSKNGKKKLEALVGSKFYEARIDDLLIASPQGKKYKYDVNMILRLLRLFSEENNYPLHRLKKFGDMLQMYLVEVAPDPKLKPCKFVKLVTAISNIATDSHARTNLALDIYLKVHRSLCEEEKMKIFSMMNKCDIEITTHQLAPLVEIRM